MLKFQTLIKNKLFIILLICVVLLYVLVNQEEHFTLSYEDDKILRTNLPILYTAMGKSKRDIRQFIQKMRNFKRSALKRVRENPSAMPTLVAYSHLVDLGRIALKLKRQGKTYRDLALLIEELKDQDIEQPLIEIPIEVSEPQYDIREQPIREPSIRKPSIEVSQPIRDDVRESLLDIREPSIREPIMISEPKPLGECPDNYCSIDPKTCEFGVMYRKNVDSIGPRGPCYCPEKKVCIPEYVSVGDLEMLRSSSIKPCEECEPQAECRYGISRKMMRMKQNAQNRPCYCPHTFCTNPGEK